MTNESQNPYSAPTYDQPPTQRQPSPVEVPTPPSEKRTISLPLWAIIAAIAVVVVLAGGVVYAVAGRTTAPSKPSVAATFAVKGTLDLHAGYGSRTFGNPCQGLGGYSDLTPGAQVVVYGGTNQALASGQLGQGFEPDQAPGADICEFPFTVGAVPIGQGPYFVSIGNRGKIGFEQSGAATVALTIGDGS